MPYGIREDVWKMLPPDEREQIAAAAKEQPPPPPAPQPTAPHPVQPQPATDALVPPGVRVADRPGVTLLEAPTRIEAPAPALHSEQPEPATDALVPAGVRIQERPGITLIAAPTRTPPPPPPTTVDTPQAPTPTDALVPDRTRLANLPSVTLIPAPVRTSEERQIIAPADPTLLHPGSRTEEQAASASEPSGRLLTTDRDGAIPGLRPRRLPTRSPGRLPEVVSRGAWTPPPFVSADGSVRVTVRVDAALSFGNGPIKVVLNPRTQSLSVTAGDFTFSDRGIVSAASEVAGANWGSEFGFHAGAAGSLPLDHPGNARFTPRAGVGRTVKVSGTTLDYSADIAAGADVWHPLAYVESLSATVRLPRQSGILSYSITLTIEPTAKAPRPVNAKPWAAGAEAAVAAGLAALAGRAYFGSSAAARRRIEPELVWDR